jgi:hypothetical protein
MKRLIRVTVVIVLFSGYVTDVSPLFSQGRPVPVPPAPGGPAGGGGGCSGGGCSGGGCGGGGCEGGGCKGSGSSKGSGPQNAFKGRLAAALALKSDPDREEALGKVAVDAAGAKDVDMTRQALQRIKTGATRAQKMGECALILARGGLMEDASDLAKTIPVEAERERILKKIATNNLNP